MKIQMHAVGLCCVLALAGCGRDGNSTGGSSAVNGNTNAAVKASAAEALLLAWHQGDKTNAIHGFTNADWSARPLFADGSPLNLTEKKFAALSTTERDAKSKEMMPQIDELKALASGVAQAGRDAAAKGDAAQAKQYFLSLKQSGGALSSADCLGILQLVGKSLVKMGDTELIKAGN